MKVCFETFGCRLNKAEALQMEAEYLAEGWELTEKHSDADLFVVRGCSVTARAQNECEKLISHLHRHYPSVPLRTCGCIEKNGEKNRADAFTSDEKKFERGRRNAQHCGGSRGEPSLAAREQPLPIRTARAYLKIQDGCSGKCTFCIVPKFRGNSVSVPFSELLDTSKRFIESGYHEIVITGCNLSLYASEGKRLPDLLAALAELTPSQPTPPISNQLPTTNYQLPTSSCRFRLGSLEPGSCALETVHVMSEHANICRFLHIPVQSGSNHVLSAMKRPYLVRDVDALISNAVKLLPGLGLGCDLMTGFPGESGLDFVSTKGLLKRLPFNNAHVFPYSERPGTPAARFGGAIPKDLRLKRAHELIRDAKRLRASYAQTFVGKTVEVIVEDKEKTVGWTGEYLKCEATGTAPRKALVKVQVTAAKDDQLTGLIV